MDSRKVKRLINLSKNENLFGSSPLATEAVVKNCGKMSLYPEPHSQSLKDRIAQKVGRDADNIFVSAGLVESLDILIRNFLSDGENMVIPEVSFVAYRLLTEVFRKEARFAKMNNFRVDVDQVLSLCDEKTRVILIDNPSNPTGTVISGSELIKILSHVPESTLVVMDEAYSEYCCCDDYPNSVELQKTYPNLIVMRTFSKIYGLAGLRVGYTIASKELIRRFEHYQAPFTVNQLASIAAHAALDDNEFVELSISSNKKCRELLLNKFVESGYNAIPSEGNFLFVYFDSQAERDQFFDRLERENVLVRKTDMYGESKAVRITIGTSEMNDLLMRYLGEMAL